MSKLSSIYEEVLYQLRRDPRLRDSDQKLVARVWSDELKRMGKNPEQMSSYEMLCMYAKDELQSADYICRCRRKVQEENPELRGETYNHRQHIETEKVKAEIRAIG